jgi:hypothetical protein
MDINEELESIIKKYRLDRHYPEYRNARKACIYLKKWIEELSELKDSVLFVSMDEYALNLIRSWANNSNIRTLLIKTTEELDDHKIEFEKASCIYVASYSRTNGILHWFWRNEYEAESVYDLLESENIYLSREFCQFYAPLKVEPELQLVEGFGAEWSEDGVFLKLYEYYYQKQRLLHCHNDADKKRINQKLFFIALLMKNFVEAEKILDQLSNDKDYTGCWLEIQQLLIKIKEKLGKKKQNNIIIYWLDALDYEEAKNMEYLQGRREHSLYFRKAFTVTPYTFPTLKTMFCGIRQVDDLGYNVTNVDLNNSGVIKEVLNHGYQMHILSNYFRNMLSSEFGYGNRIEKAKASCSEVFWNLLDKIIQNENEAVYIAHAIIERHSPSLSVRRERFEKQYAMDELKAEWEELDAQLSFYDQMLGKTPYRIYMSDHGGKAYRHQRMHIHFQVYHESWEGRDTDKLFCFLDFDKILCGLMEKRKINDDIWNREYVPIQDVDIYGGSLKTFFDRPGSYPAPYLTAFKGVITNEYMYVHYKAGNEIFYEWSNGGEVPSIGIELDKKKKEDKFISELRGKAGTFPKELDTDPKFRYAKYTYKVCDNIRQTREAVVCLINDLFDTYVDGSIALRMGGEHSLLLYSILSEENRRKIGGIIDRDDNCKCKELEYQIYKYPEGISKSITTILLSSYWHMKELREEAKAFYGGYKTIDIYQYLEQHGYHFTKEFYHGLESDWNVGFTLE